MLAWHRAGIGVPRPPAYYQSPVRPLESDDISGCPALPPIDAPLILDRSDRRRDLQNLCREGPRPHLEAADTADIVIMDNLGSSAAPLIQL
jgi:hypothetical protein